MRITIVQGGSLPIPPLEGGAVEKVWFGLGPEFARRGNQVTHISRLYQNLPAREVLNGVEHVRIKGFNAPRSRLLLWFRELFYARRVVGILPSADILVTNSVWLPALVCNKDRGALYVQIGRFPKGQTRLYRRAARLQAVSNAVAEAIKRQDPRSIAKVRTIPYPLPYPVEQFDVEQTWAAREQLILYVGRIHPEKGIHLLVEAFQELAKRDLAGWRLAVVGPWKPSQGGGGQDYYDSLRRITQDTADRIDWVGPVFDQRELVEYYRRAKLFIYPSLAAKGEASPLAPLEAMANGCAVLVSDLECFRDYLDNQLTGFVFDHHQNPVATLGRKMTEVVSNESALFSVAARGYKKAREYDLPEIAQLYFKDFECVAECSR